MANFTNREKRKNGAQHCISVMRAKQLKISIFTSNKLCVGKTVIAPKSRTTLIHGRYAASEKKNAIKRLKVQTKCLSLALVTQ